ncbi:LysM peptidoglycan-binding domain-containing protein [Fictibacillus barbaricus]|uniref:LysM peptidoglycan-binding domain-containing protein n=1 Tax=Fictibacillus barbaricus TaxID=182136 RepID=UPI0019C33554|nr:LysM domain-containing protein [Fictibacillus barbaricus]GGB53879.1 hypothetical protein GCM10007199_19460 [Fictibacillus barbaricus]
MKKKVMCMFIVIASFLFLPAITQAQVIYEVKSGDTLDKISKQYKLNRDEIAKLNGLAKNAQLVLGQALVIPGSNYYVQPGEFLGNCLPSFH